MPTLQKQDEDITNPYSVRREAPLSRASFDEHCHPNVHDKIRHISPLSGYLIGNCTLRKNRNAGWIGSLHTAAFGMERYCLKVKKGLMHCMIGDCAFAVITTGKDE